MNPVVSVVVTTFNRQELLKETLESILAQTFTDFELIVVDNHSQYDFFALTESLNDNRIKPFQNANDGVIAVNRNYGIHKATGHYIALCDDDDLWEPEKLEKQVAFMASRPSAGLCCTNVSLIGYDEPKTFLSKTIQWFRQMLLSLNLVPAKYLLIYIPFVTNSSVLFKRSLVAENGLLNEASSLKTIEDYDYWFRMSLRNRLCYINTKLVKYRVHQQQFSAADQNRVHVRTLEVVLGYWKQLDRIQKMLFSIKKKFQRAAL